MRAVSVTDEIKLFGGSLPNPVTLLRWLLFKRGALTSAEMAELLLDDCGSPSQWATCCLLESARGARFFEARRGAGVDAATVYSPKADVGDDAAVDDGGGAPWWAGT